MQRKLIELIVNQEEYDTDKAAYIKFQLDIIKANNYFSEVIDINNIGNSKNSILSMIKTSHV